MNHGLLFKPHSLGPPLHYRAAQSILPSALYMQVTESFFIIYLATPRLEESQNGDTKNLYSSKNTKVNNTSSNTANV